MSYGLSKVYQTFHFRRSWAHRGCSGLLECDNGHSLSSRDSCAFIEIGHQWKMESPISYYSPRLPKYHLDSKFGDQEDNFLRMFFLLLLGWILLSEQQNWKSQPCLNYSASIHSYWNDIHRIYQNFITNISCMYWLKKLLKNKLVKELDLILTS